MTETKTEICPNSEKLHLSIFDSGGNPEPPNEWGAWIPAALETLRAAGHATKDGYLTEAGRRFAAELKAKRISDNHERITITFPLDRADIREMTRSVRGRIEDSQRDRDRLADDIETAEARALASTQQLRIVSAELHYLHALEEQLKLAAVEADRQAKIAG